MKNKYISNMIKTSIKSNKDTIYSYLAFFIVYLIIGLVIGYNLKDAYDNVSTSNYIYNIITNEISIIQPFKDTIFIDLVAIVLLFLSFFIINNIWISYLIYTLCYLKYLIVSAIVLFAGGISGILTFFVYTLVLLALSLILFIVIYILNNKYYCKYKTIIDKDIRTKYILSFAVIAVVYLIIKLLFVLLVGLLFTILL